ncbi:hypothetical protein [Thermococcus sp. JCM 11816]|uniref:hypothetical protein n=1 Tax=Thermococcus sp. (strain JCM 11816 / KS-1) TaxID=1295125 RepID=UPI0006CFDEDC
MKPERSAILPEITAKYPSLISLASEILRVKAEEACITRDDSRPFIRVNQKTKMLELVIPVLSLCKLEKCVLESMGFPKKPVRTRNGMIIAIVVTQAEIQRINSQLSERLSAFYYSTSQC